MAGTPVTFEVLQNGAVVGTQTAVLAADGSYSFESAVVEGSFELRAKASQWLSESQSVNSSNIANFKLINGDINGDNKINVLDYAVLKANYNKTGVTGNTADLNGDGSINVLDYSILKKNYNVIGE